MDIGEDYWPWRLAPLGAQAIGAWLIAFAVGTALVLREGDLERLRVAAIAYPAFGVFQIVALVLTRSEMTGSGVALWLYGGLLAVVSGTGGYGWWTISRPRSRAHEPA